MKQHMKLSQEGMMTLLLLGIAIVILILPLNHQIPVYQSEDILEVWQPKITERTLIEKDASFLRQAYGLTNEQYASAHVYGYVGAMEVEEIAIFQADHEEQAKALYQACEKRIDQQIKSFQGYGETQVAILQAAIIRQYGNSVVLVIAQDAREWIETLEESL